MRILLLILFSVPFYNVFGQSKIICEEKYLPATFSFDFLSDTIKYTHQEIEPNKFKCYRTGIDTFWWAEYTIVYKMEKEDERVKDLKVPYVKNLRIYNINGTIEIPFVINGEKGFSVTLRKDDYYSHFRMVRNYLNYQYDSWFVNGSYIRAVTTYDWKNCPYDTGFVNNMRQGFFVYNYLNGKAMAGGRYCGGYLKIDTSTDGKYLLYYNNFGQQINKQKRTAKAIDSLNKLYNFYKFDFTFPLLVEFRDGLWNFWNEDGSPDRDIWYCEGKEVKTTFINQEPKK